jgi:hypothetical protein
MSSKSAVLDNIAGAAKLVEWFGNWPSFRDAEILEINLRRQGESQIKLHTWEIPNQTNDRGYDLQNKNVIVTFRLHDVSDASLEGFNDQNVISELKIEQTEEGFELTLEPSFGVRGMITAGRILIDFEPGRPNGSNSAKR